MTNGDLTEKEIIYFWVFLDNASLGGGGEVWGVLVSVKDRVHM